MGPIIAPLSRGPRHQCDDQRVCRIAQPRGILRHHIQDRLNVCRRAGNDAQISLVAVCCSKLDHLQFLEQPDVLDGDHGLVGEGLKELDLRRSEGTHLDAPCVSVPMSSPC